MAFRRNFQKGQLVWSIVVTKGDKIRGELLLCFGFRPSRTRLDFFETTYIPVFALMSILVRLEAPSGSCTDTGLGC